MVQILVVGDLMLDRYTWGNADRISPEAPVLVLRADHQEDRLGGAASVAGLCVSLETSVSVAGVVGDDAVGRQVSDLLLNAKINRSCVLVSQDRPTTLKERFVGRAGGRHPHQVLRVDWESTAQLPDLTEAALLERIAANLASSDAVLVSDYAKGVCSPALLRFVIDAAKLACKPVLIDPARNADYRRYHGATMILPNRSEAEAAIGDKITSPEDAKQASIQ